MGEASATTDPRGTKAAASAATWRSLTAADDLPGVFIPLVASIGFRSLGIVEILKQSGLT
jgi:hypothetical protein